MQLVLVSTVFNTLTLHWLLFIELSPCSIYCRFTDHTLNSISTYSL